MKNNGCGFTAAIMTILACAGLFMLALYLKGVAQGMSSGESTGIFRGI